MPVKDVKTMTRKEFMERVRLGKTTYAYTDPNPYKRGVMTIGGVHALASSNDPLLPKDIVETTTHEEVHDTLTRRFGPEISSMYDAVCDFAETGTYRHVDPMSSEEVLGAIRQEVVEGLIKPWQYEYYLQRWSKHLIEDLNRGVISRRYYDQLVRKYGL